MFDFSQKRVGQTLNGKYRIEQLLGVGGMAAVYRAVHRNGNRVAIKVLHPHLALNASICNRFKREGYVANKVEHPGAVRVLDDDALADGSVFLVMELLQGETVDARAERAGRRLPPDEVVGLTAQLLDVLAAAHAAGIVHRDLKPENLFLTTSGQLKVLDFGIARLHEPEAQSHTRTGSTMGTPAFMPPEQALGRTRDVDAQTDLWAVGATMYTLLSGRYVHEAETADEMRVHAGSRAAQSLAHAAPHVPSALIVVVDRALAFEKRQRWASATAMRDALLAASASAPMGYAPAGVVAASYVPPVQTPPQAVNARSPSPLPVPPTQVLATTPLDRDPTKRSTSVPVASEVGPKMRGRAMSLTRAGVAGAGVAVLGTLASVLWPDGDPRKGEHALDASTAMDAASEAEAGDETPALPAPVLDTASEAQAVPDARVQHEGGRPIPPPPRPSIPPPECVPPYTLDDQGRKHFKPECFLKF